MTNKYQFDPFIASSWIFQESRWKINALSYKGAIGLTQVMPRTGLEWAERLEIEWQGIATLHDPFINLEIGFAYLDHVRSRFQEEHIYLSAYFWGPDNVRKYNLTTTQYSTEVLERANFYKE